MVDHCGIIYFLEFLNCYQTLNADLYTKQPQHVHENLLRKCLHTHQYEKCLPDQERNNQDP